MIESRLDEAALERVYDAIAEAIDRVGDGQEATFLAKLALVLAARVGDEAAISGAITAAARDLDP